MNLIFNILLKFLNPILIFVVSLFGLVRLILGCIKNPEGAINTFIVKVIDIMHPIFPSTPDHLKVASIINNLGDQLPLVGKSVIFEVLQTIGVIISISLIVKIYKLIPFKAT